MHPPATTNETHPLSAGMNFENIPELHWELGYMYFYLLCFGVVLLGGLLLRRVGLLKVRAALCKVHLLCKAQQLVASYDKHCCGQHSDPPL